MRDGRAKRVVGIVDYKAGNIQSIENAFMHVGATVLRVRSASELESCTHVVLPGVGAFGFCAQRLSASGLTESLRCWALTEQRPLLGICVGMQLLGDRSEESPSAEGLGWIGGTIRRFPGGAGVRVPHVGWNTVRFERSFGTFDRGTTADFYFDHSFAYHDPKAGETIGACMHGVRFSAMVAAGNITAVQFHPEKSQSAGLKILSGFLSQ
jgi:glutamine amidotransferase